MRSRHYLIDQNRRSSVENVNLSDEDLEVIDSLLGVATTIGVQGAESRVPLL